MFSGVHVAFRLMLVLHVVCRNSSAVCSSRQCGEYYELMAVVLRWQSAVLLHRVRK
jgi:hypothetical protein